MPVRAKLSPDCQIVSRLVCYYIRLLSWYTNTLNSIKFTHPVVTAKIQQIFRTTEYKKVLVVWDVENDEVIKQAKATYDIEVWKISDILNEMMKEVETKPYRNDVLRTAQLIAKMKIWAPELKKWQI